MATEQKVPYEFLVRWDKEGKLQGAHVQHRTVLKLEDGRQIETLGDAMPVDIGSGQGFPLTNILQALHVDALTKCDQLAAQVAEQSAALIAKDAELATARAEKAAADAAVAALKKAASAAAPAPADPAS